MKSKFLMVFKLSLLLLSLLLTGVAVDVFAQQSSAEATELPALEIAQDATEDDSFVYSPRGRRDPFKPLIQDKQKIAKKVNKRSAKIKGPLEKFELSQYRLIALMVVKGIPRAMVAAPDGKSYTVKVGEYIGLNDGLVRNIETKIIAIDTNGLRVEKSPDRIVVEEISIDSYTGSETKENRYIVM